MARLRLTVGAIALAVAIVIAFLGFAYHGSQEDGGSTPANTLPYAIPWSIATAVLAVWVIGAIVSAPRQERWSTWALTLAFLMGGILSLMLVLDSAGVID